MGERTPARSPRVALRLASLPMSLPDAPATEPSAPEPPAARRHVLARPAWLAVGLLLVGLGSLGVFVPGLPTTVFFIGAAACFARSSPRLEQWVLNLPRIGPLVRDYRSGLGMPRRAKVAAVLAIAVAVTLSAWAIGWGLISGLVVIAGLVGVGYILARVPTRERVLAERDAEPEDR